jgi:hypothetical protein
VVGLGLVSSALGTSIWVVLWRFVSLLVMDSEREGMFSHCVCHESVGWGAPWSELAGVAFSAASQRAGAAAAVGAKPTTAPSADQCLDGLRRAPCLRTCFRVAACVGVGLHGIINAALDLIFGFLYGISQ